MMTTMMATFELLLLLIDPSLLPLSLRPPLPSTAIVIYNTPHLPFSHTFSVYPVCVSVYVRVNVFTCTSK